MQLIGMLDSPYVRRTAIALRMLGLPFEHRPLSVFRHYAEFAAINPVVKAPTLVCDDGTVLMDSTLIIDHAQALAGPARSLVPTDLGSRQRVLRSLGLALAATEKAVQIIYERRLRPPEMQHAPWTDRVAGQLAAACGELEADLRRHPPAVGTDTIDLAGITTAVAWRFMRAELPDADAPAAFPALDDFSARAEALPAFIALPHA